MPFAYDTFDELLNRLESALEHFETLGLHTHGTRFMELRHKLANLKQDLGARSREVIVERWSDNDTYYALSDARAFGNIASQIATLPSNLIPRSKLKIILE